MAGRNKSTDATRDLRYIARLKPGEEVTSRSGRFKLRGALAESGWDVDRAMRREDESQARVEMYRRERATWKH